MTQTKVIASNKYLTHYGAADVLELLDRLLTQMPQGTAYHSCLCIPVFAETESLLTIWQGTLRPQDHLVIIFGNWPSTATPEQQQMTKDCLRHLQNARPSSQFEWQLPTLKALYMPERSLLLLESTVGLPPDQGVGLARKIMMDLALGLWLTQKVKSPWIGNTDADAVLPKNYWQELTAPAPVGLKVFSFVHRRFKNTDPNLDRAHQLYEHYLHHYQQALAQGMPEYGFHTLGSIYAIHAKSYEQVRGYPKRSAGEDFYLLNKIAKTHSVQTIETAQIQLTMRASDRTPFGTGPSVAKLLRADIMEEVPMFYDRTILAHWVVALQSLQGPQQSWSPLIPSRLQQKIQRQHEQCRTERQKRHAVICAMDGLRCQQLLRCMHEGTPKMSWNRLQTEL